MLVLIVCFINITQSCSLSAHAELVWVSLITRICLFFSMTRSEISSASVSSNDQKAPPRIGDNLSDQEKQDQEKLVPPSSHKHTNSLPARYPDMAWLLSSLCALILLLHSLCTCSIVLLTKHCRTISTSQCLGLFALLVVLVWCDTESHHVSVTSDVLWLSL